MLKESAFVSGFMGFLQLYIVYINIYLWKLFIYISQSWTNPRSHHDARSVRIPQNAQKLKTASFILNSPLNVLCHDSVYKKSAYMEAKKMGHSSLKRCMSFFAMFVAHVQPTLNPMVEWGKCGTTSTQNAHLCVTRLRTPITQWCEPGRHLSLVVL